MTTITQKRKTKTMADVGQQRFTKSVFYTPPLTAKSSENFHYQLFWCWLVLINVKCWLLRKNKKQICSIILIIKMLDQKWIFWVLHARSWSMFCDVRVCYRFMTVVVKAMHTTSMHNILLENLLSDVQMCLNGSGIWRTHKLLMWLLILRVLVSAALSAALLIIKWLSLKCKPLLNDQSW